jgi:pilus assembly protein CpaF
MSIELLEKHDARSKEVNKKGVDHWALIQYYMSPIAHFFEMDGVTEICIDHFDDIKIEKFGELKKTSARFKDEAELVSFITQIGVMLKQPIHYRTHPILDGRLPTGARVNATLYPVSSEGASMSIRCFPKCAITPQQLVEFGSLTQHMLDYLQLCVKSFCNIFISGSTGSGKTTLMNVLAHFVGEKDRLLIVEDTRELQLKAFSQVHLEAPQRKYVDENAQRITMSYLIGVTLRRRPDRILVGEIRFPDAAQSFLTALNTGHNGCMATIHANSCIDALYRLDGLVAANASGLPFDFIQQQVRSTIDIVIYQEKMPLLGRRVVEIAEVSEEGVVPIFSWDYQKGEYHSLLEKSHLPKRCMKRGIDASSIF